MTDDAMREGEIEAAVAAVRRGAAKIGGGPSDAGWVVQRVGDRLWYQSWYQHEDGRLDQTQREVGDDELRAMLRRYGRKVIRRTG